MTDNTQKINAKSVAAYILLPGIIPRAKAFGNQGFGYLAFLFASVFQAVRILPPGHALLQPSNIGKFTIRQVLAAAANNIEVSRKNIDQIVVFAAIIMAIVLMFLQFFLLLFGLLTGQAFAQDASQASVTWTSMFQTQYPQVDVAFLMLDYVFGIPTLGAGSGGTTSFFGSNALLATNGPTPFHQGMHALFNFYNLALLLVGTLIFLYYIIVVVIETAQTGVPFGRRFSKLYAPLRLVIAVGLLVPFGYGFNASQYIVLMAAKLGSSFATNGWILYNINLNNEMKSAFDSPNPKEGNPTGATARALVARPRFPPSDELLYFASVYHACREVYGLWASNQRLAGGQLTGNNICINAYVLLPNGRVGEFVPNGSPACSGNATTGGGGQSDYTYENAKEDFHTGDLEIILGELNPEKNTEYAGGVRPYCGKLTVSLNHDNPSIYSYVKGDSEAGDGTWGDQAGQIAIRATEAIYFDMIKELLRVPGSGGGQNDTPNLMCASGGEDIACGESGASNRVSNNSNPFSVFGERAARGVVKNRYYDPCYKSNELGDQSTCAKPNWRPPSSVFQAALNESRSNKDFKLNNSYKEFTSGLNLQVMDDLQRRGWGGAGIWYNHIADVNGAFTGAIYSTPSVRQWPEVMEKVRQSKQAQDKAIDSCNIFTPNQADSKSIKFAPGEDVIAKVLNLTYYYFNCKKPNQDSGENAEDLVSSGVGTDTNAVTGGCNDGVITATTTGKTVSAQTSNIFIDLVSVVFGLNGLFDLRACSEIDPNTGQSKTHPLAQLATIGKSLIENAIRSMGMALGAAFGGGMIGMMSGSLGAAANSISGMFVGIASIGLTVGFILYYILPFLPFIYFFFAVGSWVKSIFEAMVGAPLWALAHLRIDGEGLPGSSAMSGYFLIFEIFLRPIVIVFGLIAAMATFGAMVVVLNNVFDLVTANVTGTGTEGSNSTVFTTGSTVESFRRGIIDQFFFTVMYAVLVYMMGSSSFKLIDSIPAHVMTWLNTRVSTFNDDKGDMAQNLTTYAALGANQFATPVLGAGRDMASGLGSALGAVAKEMSNSGGTKQ